MPACEGPGCETYSNDLLACRDPAGNVKELCSDCREAFDGIEVIEPVTDGLGFRPSDLSINQTRALRILVEAEEDVLGSGDVSSRVEVGPNGSVGHLCNALGRLRAMGLVEEVRPNEYRPTDAGEALHRRAERNGDAELIADGGRYTVETGEGYLGVWSAHDGSVQVPIGTFEGFDWDASDGVAAVPADHGIELAHDDDIGVEEEVIEQAPIQESKSGRRIHVNYSAAREIPGFEGGDQDVRGYERGERLLLVAADTDPTLDEREDTEGSA